MRFSRIRRLASVDINHPHPQSLPVSTELHSAHSFTSFRLVTLCYLQMSHLTESTVRLLTHGRSAFAHALSGNLCERTRVRLLACLARLPPFAPAAFTAFIATMASADVCSPLDVQTSPGKVHGLSGRAVGLYPMCLSVTVGFRVS